MEVLGSPFLISKARDSESETASEEESETLSESGSETLSELDGQIPSSVQFESNQYPHDSCRDLEDFHEESLLPSISKDFSPTLNLQTNPLQSSPSMENSERLVRLFGGKTSPILVKECTHVIVDAEDLSRVGGIGRLIGR